MKHIHRLHRTTFMFLTCVSHTAHAIAIGWTSVRHSVRLSVCPSHAGIVSKRLNLSSNCIFTSCSMVAHDSSFLSNKLSPEFQWELGTPQRGLNLKAKAKAKAQVLGIAPLNMRSTCQRRFTIVEVVTDRH